MSCPLCGERGSRGSWLGSTWYDDQEFRYLECCGCGSLYCSPMPGPGTLQRMYGADYQTAFTYEAGMTDPKEPQRVMEWLARLERRRFVDYGCGKGEVLILAAGLGWDTAGVELDESVAQTVSAATGLRVVSNPDALCTDGGPPADVLHLGDVIEHLTDLDRQMPEIIRLIEPGGVLLAQGPLEAGPCLFTWLMAMGRRLRPRARSEMAPYHVLLATVRGQRELFRRMGLQELEYRVSEVAWPAPARLLPSDWKRPRTLILFFVRKISQAVSRLAPGRLGNRYFYAGRLPGRSG